MTRHRSTSETETSPFSNSFDSQRVLLSPSARDYTCLIGRHATTLHASTRQDVVSARTTDASPTSKDMIGSGGDSLALPQLLVGDFAIAAVVTAAAASALTVVDRALVERSALSHTLLQSAKQSVRGMIHHPVAYLKSPTFLWMWATYASTYAAANSLRTLMEHQDNRKAAISADAQEGLIKKETQSRH
jgi:hypothetical protein